MRPGSTITMTTPSDREVMITREFNAPRENVFRALTTPALLKRWLFGPSGWTLDECDIDLRVGGRYRFLMRRADGAEMGWSGVYREVTPPVRFVATERFDDPWYPGEAIVTQSLAERAGKTTLTLTILYESRDARDTALKSPMDEGLAAGYDRLDKVLADMGPATGQ